MLDVRSLKLDQGRFYNMEDQVQRARVAVIGSEAKEKLFSGRNAIGEHIRLDGLSFEVVGVLTAKMQEGNDDINRVVYIPFTTMSDLKDTHYLDTIWFNLSDAGVRAPGTSGAFDSGDTAQVQPVGPAGGESFQPDDAGASVRDYYTGIEGADGIHRHADAGDRRSWPDEHHAGFGHATDTRDRRAKGAGGARDDTSYCSFWPRR